MSKAATKPVAERKYKVAVDNTREGTWMKTMMKAAKTFRRGFTREQLIDKMKSQLTIERSRRYISWAVYHELFVEVK